MDYSEYQKVINENYMQSSWHVSGTQELVGPFSSSLLKPFNALSGHDVQHYDSHGQF